MYIIICKINLYIFYAFYNFSMFFNIFSSIPVQACHFADWDHNILSKSEINVWNSNARLEILEFMFSYFIFLLYSPSSAMRPASRDSVLMPVCSLHVHCAGAGFEISCMRSFKGCRLWCRPPEFNYFNTFCGFYAFQTLFIDFNTILSFCGLDPQHLMEIRKECLKSTMLD